MQEFHNRNDLLLVFPQDYSYISRKSSFDEDINPFKTSMSNWMDDVIKVKIKLPSFSILI